MKSKALAKTPTKTKAKTKTKRVGGNRTKKKQKRRSTIIKASVAELRIREIESLREEVEQRSAQLLPRWNADPEDVQKSVAQLVLALVEFLRRLLERQAIRRMEAETLSSDEIERIGLALMRLEETVHDLGRRFGLDPSELNLDLGPLGRLS